MVAAVAAVDGPDAGTTWSRAHGPSVGPATVGCHTGFLAQHSQRFDLTVGRDQNLQGAGGAGPEGLGDLVIAHPGVGVGRHDRDGGHVDP